MRARWVRRAGVTLAAAGLMVLVSVAPASARISYGGCNRGPLTTFEFDVVWDWADAARTKMSVIGFDYRIYGSFGNKNNIELKLVKMGPGPQVDLWVGRRDEIPKTSNWTYVDVNPNILLPASAVLKGRGWAKFDAIGPDPTCTGWTPAF